MATALRKYVLFVHGIGDVQPGYSDAPWRILWPTGAPADTRKIEVNYSDIFRRLADKFDLAGFADRFQVAALIERLVHDAGLADQIQGAARDFLVNAAADVFFFVALEDATVAIKNTLKLALTRVCKEAQEQDPHHFPRNLRIHIVSHSLGTAVTYLVLHDIVDDPAIGLPARVTISSLSTLASPLELIRRVCIETGMPSGPGIIKLPIFRPVADDPETDESYSNIIDWYSYRHEHDWIASLCPLRGGFLSSPDAPPFAFDTAVPGSTHALGSYVEQARDEIAALIREA